MMKDEHIYINQQIVAGFRPSVTSQVIDKRATKEHDIFIDIEHQN